MDQRVAWNKIGRSFDATRQEPWPVVEDWLSRRPTGLRLLDVMGGNGRHAALARHMGHDAISLDWSQPLCESAERRSVPAIHADATHLPIRDGAFGGAMYIAGLHGLPTKAARRASLTELHRILAPGADSLMTVWSRQAKRFADVPEDGPTDVVVPWRRDGYDVPRTYHLYTPASLQADLEAVGFVVADCQDGAVAGPSPDNIVAEFTRP